MASTSGRTLTREAVQTCISVLERIQTSISTTEQKATKQLVDWLAHIETDTLSDDEDKSLDAATRALLAEYHSDKLFRSGLSRNFGDMLGDSPCSQSHPFSGKFNFDGEEALATELERLTSWRDFDVFKVSSLSFGWPLLTVTRALLDRFGLIDKLQIDRQKMTNFLTDVEESYSTTNPYHNNIHAADVTQSLGCILTTDDFACKLSDLELLSMIISAAVHDIGHPGVTNEYLINSDAKTALDYNDLHVNENMHVSLAFKLYLKPQNSFLAHLPPSCYRFFRRTVISIVLATDMARHADLVADFNTFASLYGGDISSWSGDKKCCAMQLSVHCSDIANPAKPLPFCTEWTDRVLQEFFAQGDLEREKGYKVSAQCDRDQVDVAKSQQMFLQRVVKPCYVALGYIAPKSAEIALACIREANAHWQKLLEERRSSK